MSQRTGLSRRGTFLIAWTARLALFVFLLQLSALDHRQTSGDDLEGVTGSTYHVNHCHGDTGACGDSGATVALMDVEFLPLAAAPSLPEASAAAARLPAQPFLPAEGEPPRI